MSPSAERNERVARLLAYIDGRAVTEAHAYRTRVRVAGLHPPTGPFPTLEAVDQALADTAPTTEEQITA